jgi:hypothetical protein
MAVVALRSMSMHDVPFLDAALVGIKALPH